MKDKEFNIKNHAVLAYQSDMSHFQKQLWNCFCYVESITIILEALFCTRKCHLCGCEKSYVIRLTAETNGTTDSKSDCVNIPLPTFLWHRIQTHTPHALSRTTKTAITAD